MHAHAAETASDAHAQKTAESLPHQEALPGPEFESIAWKAGESREKIQTPAGTPPGSAQKPTPMSPGFPPIELFVLFWLTAPRAGGKRGRLKDWVQNLHVAITDQK